MVDKDPLYDVAMDCEAEELSDVQKEFYGRRDREYAEFIKKFDAIFKCDKSLENGKLNSVIDAFRPATGVQVIDPLAAYNHINTPRQNFNLLQSSINSSVKVVNSNPLGLLVPNQPSGVQFGSGTHCSFPPASYCNFPPSNVNRLPISSQYAPASSVDHVSMTPPVMATPIKYTPPTWAGRGRGKFQHTPRNARPALGMRQSSNSTLSFQGIRKKVDQNRPMKKNKIEISTDFIDLDKSFKVISTANDSSENKLSGENDSEKKVIEHKTYPSLIISIKPCLCEEVDQTVLLAERKSLDERMVKFLSLSPAKFTEWLIRKRLLRRDHVCLVHHDSSGAQVRLKLGICADINKFSYSGGYVWLSDCCPQQYVSVFHKSIFEGSSVDPKTLMKLIYHWACHTPIANVMKWLKVSLVIVKNCYQSLRALCAMSVNKHLKMIGGPGKQLQIGIVSLRVSNNDSAPGKNVIADIVCVFDPEQRSARLHAVYPVAVGGDNCINFKMCKKFQILTECIDKNTLLLVHNFGLFTILRNLGFTNISFNPIETENGTRKSPNYEATNYIKTVIPKIFGSTLSLFPMNSMQQFLDELAWRERWGKTGPAAFDSIIKEIIKHTQSICPVSRSPSSVEFQNSFTNENTQSNTNDTLEDRPSDEIETNSSTRPQSPEEQVQREEIVTDEPPEDHPDTSDDSQSVSQEPLPSGDVEKSKETVNSNTRQVPKFLEPYYYGSVPGIPSLINKDIPLKVECYLCSRQFVSNVKFLDHLIRHSMSPSKSTQPWEVCKLCCEIHFSLYSLKFHTQEVHSVGDKRFTCLICDLNLENENSLASHMVQTHSELEMPYRCRICRYKTSLFLNFIDHVKHDHNGDGSGFCPYCFAVFDFSVKGYNLMREQFRFICHFQRHQLNLNRKCYKCRIWCQNKSILKEHEREGHKSCALLKGVERFSEYSSISLPTQVEKPSIQPDERYKLETVGSFNIIPETPELKVNFYGEKRLYCIECHGKVDESHFASEITCTSCKFKTRCLEAMNEHDICTHSVRENACTFFRNIPTFQLNYMYCFCSFSTRDGNVMAKHLVRCGNWRVYLSEVELTSIVETYSDDSQSASSSSYSPDSSESGNLHFSLNHVS